MKKLLLLLCALLLGMTAFPFSGCVQPGRLIVATNAEFPPFEYKEGNKYLGIDMELAYALGEELGLEVVIEDMPFESVVTSVQQGSADIALAALTVTEKREKVVNFSVPYFEASQYIIVKSDNTAFDELTTKEEIDAAINAMGSSAKIGFQTGTTGEAYANGSEDFDFEGYASASKSGYNNGSLAVLDLLNDRINIVVIDEMPARVLVEAHSGVKLIEVPLTDERYAIAVNKNKSGLLDDINEILDRFLKDGTFNEIVAKYFADEE